MYLDFVSGSFLGFFIFSTNCSTCSVHKAVLGVKDNTTEKTCSDFLWNLGLVEEAKPAPTKILSRRIRQNMNKYLTWIVQLICYSQGVLSMSAKVAALVHHGGMGGSGT